MSETVEFEMKKQFENYIIIVKNMSEDKETGFYDAYGDDALVFGYIMKQKIKYRNFRTAKIFKKMHYSDKSNEKKQKLQKVFTAYSGVPLNKLQEMIGILDYYHVNYIVVDKMQNYQVTHINQFKDNKYNIYYQKGLYYNRIMRKVKNINEFLKTNSDSGEIMYLIYDIERCIDDYRKRTKFVENKNVESKNVENRKKIGKVENEN